MIFKNKFYSKVRFEFEFKLRYYSSKRSCLWFEKIRFLTIEVEFIFLVDGSFFFVS